MADRIRHRVLRRAGAALIGVISVLVVTHAFGGKILVPEFIEGVCGRAQSNAAAVISLAEQGEAPRSEAIIIANLSPDIQKPAVAADVCDLVMGKTLPLRPHHFGARLDRDIMPIKFAPDRKLAALPVMASRHVNKPANIAGG